MASCACCCDHFGTHLGQGEARVRRILTYFTVGNVDHTSGSV